MKLYRSNEDQGVLVGASVALMFIAMYGGYKGFYIMNIQPDSWALGFVALLFILSITLGFVGIREYFYSGIPALEFLADRALYRKQTARRPTEILYSEIKGTGIREVQVKATLRRYVDIYKLSDEKISVYTNDLSESAEDIMEYFYKNWMGK